MASWYEIEEKDKTDDKFLAGVEDRFQVETARIRSETIRNVDYLKPTNTYNALTPKQKRWLVGGAILVSSIVTAIGFGHKTIGDGFRTIFPDDQPPITRPVRH